MGNETANEDFPEQEQRSAVCYRQWRENKAIESTGTDEVQVDDNKAGTFLDGWNSRTNALKAISSTDDVLRVGNYIVVFNGRDLEGVGSSRVNLDGTRGEFFVPDVELESDYTKAGTVFVDWEHGGDGNGPDGEALGIVDWKTARRDERGVWVERVLNRRSRYVKWLEDLIEAGLIGSSSEAVAEQTQKAADGGIHRWPLRRDTLTVEPMEPRMIQQNHIQAFKALGIPVPDDNVPEPEPEPEASPEAAPVVDGVSAVDVARARARAQQILLSLEE